MNQTPPSDERGPILRSLTHHYRNVRGQISKHIGYDVAKRGWDNDAPMSSFPKLHAVREVFKCHAKNIPFMIISPVLWSELTNDLSKAIAPDKDSKLLPRFNHSKIERDLAYFKPDEDYKKRLQRSTSLETSRSLTRSFFKISGMYLSKAGPREFAIASALAAATFYTSYESVNVLAEFSYWGRDFNNFYISMGGTSQAFKTGILDALKAAYQINPFAANTELIQTIFNNPERSLDVVDVAKSISGVKINPETTAKILEAIQNQFGSLSLQHFSNGLHTQELRSILSGADLPFKQTQEVIDAIQNGAQIKQSAIVSIAEIKAQFANFDFNALNAALAAHEETVKVMQANIKTMQSSNEAAMKALQANLNMSLPESIDKIQTMIAEHKAALKPLSDKLADLQKKYVEIVQPLQSRLDLLMADNVLAADSVGKNTNRMMTKIPAEFCIMLGKFLAFALPAFYFAQHLVLRWQTWMTGKLCNEWNKYNAAYKIRFGHTNIDNPDQRIQENLSQITGFVVNTTTEGMQTGLQLAIFLPMLAAMGSFNPAFLGGPDIMIENFLTWSALGYAAVATGVLGSIAYSLPKIKRRFQEASGSFRAALMSVHSQPEQIALARGEEQEKRILREKHDPVVDVSIQKINKSTQMMTANSIFGNVGSYIPLVLAAPQYAAGIIDYGQVTQAAGIFRRVETSFEFIKSNIEPFSDFKAALDRTAQLVDALELARYEELERRYYQMPGEQNTPQPAPVVQ